MVDHQRRRDMLAAARQTRPDAGVYRITIAGSGKSLLGSTPNLAGFRSRFEFAKTSRSTGALDHRLRADVGQFGFEALSLEVVDTLTIGADMTPEEVSADLAALEALWREKENSPTY